MFINKTWRTMVLFDNVITLRILYLKRERGSEDMIDENSKTERIAMRLTAKTRKLIDELAKKENKTLSSWCESAILDKINRFKEIDK